MIALALPCAELMAGCADKYENCGEAGLNLDCDACEDSVTAWYYRLQDPSEVPEGGEAECVLDHRDVVGCWPGRARQLSNNALRITLAVEVATGNLVELYLDPESRWLEAHPDLYCAECVTCEMLTPCFESEREDYCEGEPDAGDTSASDATLDGSGGDR